MRGIRATIVAVEKQQVLYIAYVSVALGIQHAMRMRHIVICGLFDSAIFSHIISQSAQFLGPVTEHKTCVLIFSTTSAILRRTEREMIINFDVCVTVHHI